MVRITSAWCIYEFRTFLFTTYIFVFTTRFLMLFLFLTIAQLLMFSNTFFMFLDLKSKLISSLKIWLISWRISNTAPGKMQHNLSVFLLSEERTVMQAEVFCFIIFHSVKDKQLFCKDYLQRIKPSDMLLPP